jgi:hypothetical protein
MRQAFRALRIRSVKLASQAACQRRQLVADSPTGSGQKEVATRLAALADPEQQTEALELIHGLGERVEPHPAEEGFAMG